MVKLVIWDAIEPIMTTFWWSHQPSHMGIVIQTIKCKISPSIDINRWKYGQQLVFSKQNMKKKIS